MSAGPEQVTPGTFGVGGLPNSPHPTPTEGCATMEAAL